MLRVPILPNGTGEAQASATFETLQDWNFTDRVHFIPFDTTASNTGLKSGAFTIGAEIKPRINQLDLPASHP